jgi:hypothetical protein
MSSSLRELAQAKLDDLQRLGRLKKPPTVDWMWLLSALRSIVEGRLVEPDIDALKQLTTKARLWEALSPAWPPDHVSSVIGAVVASHRLAIVRRDDEWLTQLHAGWEACPEDVHYLLRLRALGEIGLGLAPGGPRPFGWSEEELSELDEGGFLRADVLADRPWRAVAQHDLEAARHALTDYEHLLATLQEKWKAAPSEGLREILAFPDVFLQVERRALAALLDRARP